MHTSHLRKNAIYLYLLLASLLQDAIVTFVLIHDFCLKDIIHDDLTIKNIMAHEYS